MSGVFGRPLSRVARRGAVYLGSLVVLAAFLFPIAWMVAMSFKTRLDIFTWPPKVFSFTPTLENYEKVLFGSKSFLHYVANSVEIAAIATLIAVAFGVTTAFALAKGRVGNSKALGFLLLSFRMMPPVALLLPYYLLFRSTGLLGTIPAIAITHAVFSIAIVIWMMRAFFEEVPNEIEEAATIDGATPWQVFIRITLPMSRPAIAAATIFALMTSWNEFVFAVVLSNTQTRTVPVAISSFVGEVYVSWGELAAATTIGMVPTLILAFIGQRYLLYGLTFGGVK
ncbi:MAG: carbohydrate ABC transporter permease [Bauldia sp.]|uniref:carbohydrate ABC transporter permease n=1 Tax=Bauldia sp. TaxID=2575872 RepID=UPI001DFEDD66|nr:carbohydrate ABC transporter permease [Bauldia sp.]MCB1497814.1 carbohydrate ABC transporter permease [Bauldia sp.]